MSLAEWVERQVAGAAAVDRRLPAAAWQSAAVLAGALALLALCLRAVFLDRSYEVFFDEVVYVEISRNLAATFSLTYDGHNPFFLHPPLFFLLEAGYLRLTGAGGDPIALVFAARALNACFAAATVAVLFALLRRVAGWAPAVAGCLLFALDPFVIRVDSRNLLEPSALLWVLAGLLLLLPLASGPDRQARAVLAGCAFAAALLTNEPTAVITLLPLALAVLWRLLQPRTAAVVAGTAVALYAVYPLTVAATGNWTQFAWQQGQGARRFIGLLQASGFNAGHGPGFHTTLMAHASLFLTTYLLVGLGAVATLVLLLLPGAGRMVRLAGLFTGSAYLLQVYSILFGTNEEQYFYYPVVMAIVAVAVAFTAVRTSPWARERIAGRGGLAVPAAAAGLVAVVLGWSAQVWLTQRTTPDDGYRRVFVYLGRNVPAGTHIAGTNETDTALLDHRGYVTSSASTPASVSASGARYVLVSTLLVDEGYGTAKPQLLAWLDTHGDRVVTFSGPTDGTLVLYRVRGA